MSIVISYVVDPNRMLGMFSSLRENLRGPNVPGLKKGFTEAGDAQLAYLRRRYWRLSGGGGEWPPTAANTGRRKAPGRRILIDTGKLFSSLRRGNRNCVFSVSSSGLFIGNFVSYFLFHQRGTIYMPQRQIAVPPDEQTKQTIKKSITAAIRRSVRIAAERPQGGLSRVATY